MSRILTDPAEKMEKCRMDENQTFEQLWDYWQGLPILWEELKKTRLPVYLYGMGDGAEKIHRAMEQFGIPLAGVFASDEYVRGHSFLGFQVRKLSQVEETEKDGFVILLAFGAFLPDLTEKIKGIAEKHRLYAPDTPVAGENLFTLAFLNQNRESFRRVYSLLADEKSRQVLKNVVAFKLTGEIHYLFDCETSPREVYDSLIPLKGRKDVLVDLGGYDGDTVRSWITESEGQYDRILTLEPDAKNFKKMQKKLQGWDLSRVTCVNAAAHSQRGKLVFALRGGRNSALLGTGGLSVRKTFEVDAMSVDDLLQGQNAGLIKMDVEGNEAEAMKGAKKTIERTHPPLMISAYHRSEDLFALPLLTQQLAGGGYRFYLRHHPYIPAWETNYYALPEEKTENS